jgi:hypothetical protein
MIDEKSPPLPGKGDGGNFIPRFFPEIIQRPISRFNTTASLTYPILIHPLFIES